MSLLVARFSTSAMRRALVKEMLRKGKRNSPHAIQHVQRIVDRLGPKDLLVFNALLEISVHKQMVGDREVFLEEMDRGNVVPDQETLRLLLHAMEAEEWKTEAPSVLITRFRKQYGVKKLSPKVGELLVEGYGRAGRTGKAMAVFRSVPALEGSRAAWKALVEAYAAVGKCQEAVALLQSMHRVGQRASVDTVNRILEAASQPGEEEALEAVLEFMKENRIVPTLDTIDSLVERHT